MSQKTIKLNQRIAAIITIVIATLNLMNGIGLVIKGNNISNNPLLTGQWLNNLEIFGSLGQEFVEIGLIGVIGAVILITLMAFYLYKRSINLGYFNAGVLILLPLLGLIIPTIAPAAPIIYIVLGIYLAIFVFLEVKNKKAYVLNQPTMINNQAVQPQTTPIINPNPVVNPVINTPSVQSQMNQPVDNKPKQLNNNQPQKPSTYQSVNKQAQQNRSKVAPSSNN